MAPGSEDVGSYPGAVSASPLLGGAVVLALVVAFSPVLVDLVHHLSAEPWARSMLVVPWLLWLAARVDRPARAPALGRPIVLGCLVFALLFQVAAIGGDALRWARAGVAVSIAVSLWATGSLGPRGALLALWLLPVPSFVVDAMSPGLEVAMGRAAGAIAGLGFEGTPFDPALSTPGGRLALDPVDGGLALCAGLAGLGWARGVFEDRSSGEVAGGALLGGLLGLPVQFLVLLVSAGIVSVVASADTGRAVLDHAGATIIILGGLGLTPLARSGRRRREAAAAGEGAVPC